jgi:hypothetical protein
VGLVEQKRSMSFARTKPKIIISCERIGLRFFYSCPKTRLFVSVFRLSPDVLFSPKSTPWSMKEELSLLCFKTIPEGLRRSIGRNTTRNALFILK